MYILCLLLVEHQPLVQLFWDVVRVSWPPGQFEGAQHFPTSPNSGKIGHIYFRLCAVTSSSGRNPALVVWGGQPSGNFSKNSKPACSCLLYYTNLFVTLRQSSTDSTDASPPWWSVTDHNLRPVYAPCINHHHPVAHCIVPCNRCNTGNMCMSASCINYTNVPLHCTLVYVTCIPIGDPYPTPGVHR